MVHGPLGRRLGRHRLGVVDMKDHALATRCPFCSRHNPIQSAVDSDYAEPPHEGDVGLCIGCGGIALFDVELQLRKPTDRERLELDVDPEVQLAVQQWREMDAKRNYRWKSTKS